MSYFDWQRDKNLSDTQETEDYEELILDKEEIFQCERLDWLQVGPPEVQIKSIAISPRAIYVITSDKQLFRWKTYENYQSPREELEISNQYPDLQEVFTDDSGYHTLVTMARSTKQGTHYFHLSSTESVFINKLHDFTIKSVAWNKQENKKLTNEILLGTDTGAILELVFEFNNTTGELINHYYTRLFDFNVSIDGISSEIFPPNRFIVLVATKNTLYQFLGVHDDRPNYAEIFWQYKRNPQLLTEISHEVLGSIRESQIQISYNPERRPKSFVWLSAGALMYGKFAKYNRELDIVRQMTPVPYRDIIVGMAMTRYHFYLLYEYHLDIISKQNIKVIHMISFEDQLLGIKYSSDSLYIWSSSNVYQIQIQMEGRDVWKYLVEQKKFQQAIKFCEKHSLPFLSKVKGAYGNFLLSQKQPLKAAEAFAECDELFEELTLKLMDFPESLKKFLQLKLGQMPSENLAQRTLLSTWIINIQLTLMNKLLMKDNQSDIKTASADLKQFFYIYKNDLDENTTYALLQSHGRVDEWVHFAELNGNYKLIMMHYLNQHDYKNAIRALTLISPSYIQDKMVYKYANLLVKHEPSSTVDLLITVLRRSSHENIDIFLSALMSIPIESREQSIRFEHFCILELKLKDKLLHQLYMAHLAELDESMLIDYLNSPEGHDIDIDYAVKVCENYGKTEALINLYSLKNMYTEAVTVALENQYLHLAVECAKKPKDLSISKKLSLQIAEFLTKSERYGELLSFVQDTEGITMEDVVPMLDESLSISQFKSEICSALVDYHENIQQINQELVSSNESSNQVSKEIEQVQKRQMLIDCQKTCEICAKVLIKKSFYVYPCLHAYHRECLEKTFGKIFYKKSPKKFFKLTELLRATELDEEQIDNLISSSCYICGDLYIESIHDDYIDDSTELAKWDI